MGWEWISSRGAIGIGAVLLLAEVVLDKVPAVDTVNDAIQTFIRPATGGVVFAATSAAEDGASAGPSLAAVFVPILALVPFAALAGAFVVLWRRRRDGRDPMMTLTSSSFDDGGPIAQRYGKRFDNVSPELSWQGAPTGTASFALACVDTHPVARGYVHWLVTGIGPDVTGLPEGAAAGAMPPGSREPVPYAGPFPPSGTHDYEFTLYALDSAVGVPAGAAYQRFVEAVASHTLATAKLVGQFTTSG